MKNEIIINLKNFLKAYFTRTKILLSTNNVKNIKSNRIIRNVKSFFILHSSVVAKQRIKY